MYRNFSFDERFIIKLHSKSFLSNFWGAVQILIQPLFAIYTICSRVNMLLRRMLVLAHTRAIADDCGAVQ